MNYLQYCSIKYIVLCHLPIYMNYNNKGYYKVIHVCYTSLNVHTTSIQGAYQTSPMSSVFEQINEGWLMVLWGPPYHHCCPYLLCQVLPMSLSFQAPLSNTPTKSMDTSPAKKFLGCHCKTLSYQHSTVTTYI